MASLMDFLGLSGSGLQPTGGDGGLLANFNGAGTSYADIMNNLNNNRGTMMGLGLGLLSGTKYNPFGDLAQSTMLGMRADNERAKTQMAGLTSDIKEFQYAKSTGAIPNDMSFTDYQKQAANLKNTFGINPQGYEYKDENGNIKYGIAQTSSGGGLNPLKAPGGGEWTRPQMQINTPQGVQVMPRNQSQGLPGAAPSGAAPGPFAPQQGAGGTFYPKNYEGPEEDKKIGQERGEEFNKFQSEGIAAVKQKTTYARMSQLNDAAYQGAGAPGLQYTRSLLSTFGVDPGKVPAGEELTTLSNRLVLDATGGSLGNQISNTDRDFIAAQNPNLANTREGRARIIEVGNKIADRKIEVAQMAQAWKDQNGSMKGFNQYLAKWAEANPLFPQAGQGGGGENTKTINGKTYYQRGGKWYTE